MAADQRRKLLNGATIAACTSSDQHKIKKKKLKSSQNDLIAKSHISLEWDGNHKKVVAKKEQVGISCRHLRPFIDSAPHYHSVLADVFTLPREIFELEDLTQVISYEAWKTQLSEKERNHLTQFLPKGTDREQILQTLLAGENFHFGNPFLQWSASLCSGHLHPDAVISHEQCLKADKKAYYSELHKYHDEIIGHLQKLKENWKSREDPETEISQNIWRSRKDPEKRTLSGVNESRLADTEQDASATSESCSWNAEEKACTSDNQNSSVVKGVESQKRKYKEGIIKDKHRASLITSDDVLNKEAKPRRGEKLQKPNIQQSDGVKYMSYIKISKKQHELVKSMKQSGKSIQSRSLNRVLGNLNSFHVQPYEVFMEEEKSKLHEHWLKLAIEDLPMAYANWRDVCLVKREIIKSLNQDLHDKLNAVLEDGMKSAEISQHQEENGVNSKVLDEERENLNCEFQDQNDNEQTESESYMQDSGESPPLPGSSHDQSCQQLSVNSSYLCSHMDLDSVKSHHISKLDASSSDASEYSGNLKAADVPVNQGVHLSPTEDVWPGHGALHSYHDSTAGCEYTAVSGLSLTHQQTNENQRSQLINLDSGLPEEDARKVLLHGQSDGGSFSSFPNQHRNELLQSLFKDERMLSYNHEQKPTGLDFQSPKNLFTGDSRFPGHFQEQLQPSLALEQGQKRQSEIYMQQNISPNIYTDGGRFVIPRQELLPSSNMADWTVNPVRMPAPYQQQLNSGDLFSQNWFPSEHQVRNGWSGSDGVSVSNQGIGSAASNSNADQSLFSVLSQCSQLRSGNPYGPMRTPEQFISAMPRNYGMVGGGNSAMSNNLPQVNHPLDYLGGRDAATPLMADDMGWMNLTHQNPGLHDPMGKPYLRSWNQ
ncbi:hypothetical protein SLEP1_g51568 [Rubroshorea leprosula]|uniref:DEUBAD domain-containing protein n=1 Tax=Rubroshorea leprosula TaxID=152421 RepID=A0AAV5M3K9_9ROSI|nr:hypothetical protein SLEP1_g51568 [Rubroshorea leprosula]